jgi:hypothetical protein
VDQHQRKHRSVILGAHELPHSRGRPQSHHFGAGTCVTNILKNI